MMAKLIPFLLFFMPIYALAQSPEKPLKKGKESYIYWGYHRNFYAPSDIHFQSSRYDFTMYDVKANDMPAKSEQYFRLHDFSVPQFNFRMGQELKNNWFCLWDMTTTSTVLLEHRMLPSQETLIPLLQVITA